MQITKRVVKEISKFCCEKMESASDSKAIQLPNLEMESVPMKPRIFGPRDSRIHNQPSAFEIDFCPFCGEKIRFEEKK